MMGLGKKRVEREPCGTLAKIKKAEQCRRSAFFIFADQLLDKPLWFRYGHELLWHPQLHAVHVTIGTILVGVALKVSSGCSRSGRLAA